MYLMFIHNIDTDNGLLVFEWIVQGSICPWNMMIAVYIIVYIIRIYYYIE